MLYNQDERTALTWEWQRNRAKGGLDFFGLIGEQMAKAADELAISLKLARMKRMLAREDS